jgi:hypothetical protein
VGFAGGSGGEGLVAGQRSGCHGEPREAGGCQSVAHRERGGLAGWPIAQENDGLGATGNPAGGQPSTTICASANSLHRRFRRVSVFGWNILQQMNFCLARELHRATRAQRSKLLQAKDFVRASWLLGCSLAAGMTTEDRESRSSRHENGVALPWRIGKRQEVVALARRCGLRWRVSTPVLEVVKRERW